MTVSSTTNKASYNGDGNQSVFAYSFKIFVDADLQVYVGETLKTINTHYTLSGVGGSSGGNVTFTAGNIPASGSGNVTLLRSLPLTQEVDLINYGKFDAEVVEAQYDRLTMMLQQLQEQTGRTIRFSTTVSDAGGIEISDTIADRKNKVLAYDANGDLSVANELGQWRGNWETSTTFKARDLVVDPATNNVYICLLAHTSNTLNTDVSDLKFGLIINASAVAASAAIATTKAAEAAASESAASSDLQLTNADVVLTHADVVLAEAAKVQAALDRIDAAGSASQSGVSAAASANSAASAAAAFDNFDDKYLGAKSSEPSTDNDGDALATGNLYFLTGTGMQVYDGANWIAASSSGNVSMYAYEYVSIAGQTTFTGADTNGQTLSYTPNNIHVTYGGLDIPKADYTATNGTSIVLDDGALLGKIVRIVAFESFVVANTYTKVQADTLLATKATNTALATTNTAVALKAPIAAPVFTGDITVSGGVYLGGTAALNNLNYYEEGEWTPVISDASSGGNMGSYASQSGFNNHYVRVGTLVTVRCSMTNIVTTGMGTGNIYVLGLPFVADGQSVGSMSVSYYTAPSNGISIVPVVENNDTYISLKESISNATRIIANSSSFTSGTADIYFTISYETDG